MVHPYNHFSSSSFRPFLRQVLHRCLQHLSKWPLLQCSILLRPNCVTEYVSECGDLAQTPQQHCHQVDNRVFFISLINSQMVWKEILCFFFRRMRISATPCTRLARNANPPTDRFALGHMRGGCALWWSDHAPSSCTTIRGEIIFLLSDNVFFFIKTYSSYVSESSPMIVQQCTRIFARWSWRQSLFRFLHLI